MPLRRKGKKARATSATSIENPVTMMSGDTGGTKKKKKKLTKAEKALAKLEKETDALRKSGAAFKSFVDRLDKWLVENSKRAIELFRKFDQEAEGVVTYDEFKSGSFDLNIPCNKIELHCLCQLLDIDEEEVVDYMNLGNGLVHVREREATYTHEDVRPALTPTKKVAEYAHCKNCKLALWDGESYSEQYPRYILVMLRLVTFDGTKNHPGHLNAVVHSHTTVAGLMDLIHEQTNLLSTKLAIFIDKTRSPEARLPVEMSLEDCGFKGGTRDEPEELLLYYDYVVEFTECPLLMCDHYFGQKYE